MLRFCLLFALTLVVGTLLAAAPAAADAAPVTFDFKDPKETNAVSLAIDAAWEPVVGYATGISGTATFDPAAPEATRGKIVVEVASIRFTNDGYGQTVRSYALEGAKYPVITCEIRKIARCRVVKPGRQFAGDAEAAITCHGITKVQTIPMRVGYYPGVASKRFPDSRGDLLNVRADFTIRRSDFDLVPDMAEELVADEVSVRVSIVGTTAAAAATPAPAGALTVTTPDGRDHPVADRMRFYRVPGLSVAVIRDFAVARVVHFGEAAPGRPATDDTLYPAGAMGQPVVAFAALHAAQRGDLSLDADVRSLLRAWQPPRPEGTAAAGARALTVRDLLTHRSGFTHRKYGGYAPGGPVPTLRDVLDGRAPAVTPPARPASAPGAAFALAAENYAVLQQVAEEVSGGPFENLLRSLVFAPLKMDGSTFAGTLPGAWVGRAAVGHDGDGNPLPAPGWRVYPESAASGLWTTPRDYALFLAELLRCAAGRDGALLSKASGRTLVAPIGTEGEAAGQSIATGLQTRGGVRYLYKGGNAAGYYCHFDADPARGNAVVVFASGDLCWRLANEVRDSVARAEGWPGYGAAAP